MVAVKRFAAPTVSLALLFFSSLTTALYNIISSKRSFPRAITLPQGLAVLR
jgi:hypothetical protein